MSSCKHKYIIHLYRHVNQLHNTCVSACEYITYYMDVCIEIIFLNTYTSSCTYITYYMYIFMHTYYRIHVYLHVKNLIYSVYICYVHCSTCRHTTSYFLDYIFRTIYYILHSLYYLANNI